MSEKSPRGRPPLVRGDRSTPINVRVSTKIYDKASARSRRDRVSVPTVVRRALARWLKDDEEEGDE